VTSAARKNRARVEGGRAFAYLAEAGRTLEGCYYCSALCRLLLPMSPNRDWG